MAGGDRGGLLGGVQPPVQAEDGVVLHQCVVERGGGDGAAREPDDDDPALEGHAFGGGRVGVAADRVVDDVGAASAGELLDAGDDVLRRTVDHQVAAELLGGARLGLASDDPDDGGPGGLAELDLSLIHYKRQDVQGGGLGVVEGVRGGEQGARGRGDVLGETAVRQARIGDDTAPVLGLAADLHAGGEGQRRPDLVLPPDEQRVGEVDVGGEHPESHLTLAGDRFGNLFEAHGLTGLAGGMYSPCLHPGPPAAVEESHSARILSGRLPSCEPIGAPGGTERSVLTPTGSGGSPRRSARTYVHMTRLSGSMSPVDQLDQQADAVRHMTRTIGGNQS